MSLGVAAKRYKGAVAFRFSLVEKEAFIILQGPRNWKPQDRPVKSKPAWEEAKARLERCQETQACELWHPITLPVNGRRLPC